MVPDRQKVRTDGRNGRTDDAKTISLRLRRGIKIPLDPIPGVKGVCKGKIFASILLYASFPLI